MSIPVVIGRPFRIERTILLSQSSLAPMLPMVVMVDPEDRSNYKAGREGCKCRKVYRIRPEDTRRIEEMTGRLVKGEVYLCECYGTLVRWY